MENLNTVEDFTTLDPAKRYVELAKRIVELKRAREELSSFHDDMTGNSEVPWDPVSDGFIDPDTETRYMALVEQEELCYRRAWEMVKDAIGNEAISVR